MHDSDKRIDAPDEAQPGQPADARTVAQRWADLRDERDRLEAELAAVTKRLADLEPDVLSWFETQGVSSARLDGGRTIHVRRELWAGREEGVDAPALAAAVAAAGLPEFVSETVNLSRLSAYCRELDREGQPLPAPLLGVVRVREVFRVGTARAAAGRGDKRGTNPGASPAIHGDDDQ